MSLLATRRTSNTGKPRRAASERRASRARSRALVEIEHEGGIIRFPPVSGAYAPRVATRKAPPMPGHGTAHCTRGQKVNSRLGRHTKSNERGNSDRR